MGWIVIPGWEKFQHRDAGRSGRGLTWLRDYADQGNKDEYRELSYHCRGLLRDIRHSYATTQGQLSDSTLSLTRRFGQRVMRRDLQRLVDAGFIEILASKPLELRQQAAGLEVEVEVEPLTPNLNPAKPSRSIPASKVIESFNRSVSKRCPICNIAVSPPTTVADHIHLQHGNQEAA